ncbi:MFS transporter [Agrobacterium tumefaciens]|uniref:MFS transporter n=1 Tax=Agrobacterium tumefaciens TaxID=358 RepID=A0A4D7YPK8_AGRTU|nr:MFS transporter [Agrobacterium tumefaciens]QCL97687.1 MFS transporter [Agrobacterium tumefaciens]
MSQKLYNLSPGLLLAIVVHAAVAPVVLLTAPAVAAQYGGQFGFGAGQIGFLFSAELAAMSLATLPAYYWQKRWNWKNVALAAGLLFIAANIVSAFAASYTSLLILRFLSAFGGGTLMVIGMASVVLSNQRDRVYGLWVCGQLVIGAVGLWILPGLFQHYGLSALYIGLAVLMALALPLARCYPANLEPNDGGRPQRMSFSARNRAIISILGLLSFYIGLSGVWTFIGSIASAAGIDPASTGELLSIATVFGIVGSLVATGIGDRITRSLALLAGYAVMTTSILLLFHGPNLWRFAVAACAFKFVWTFVLPFILGTISDQDRDGGLMNTANLAVGGGLAIGPAVAGQILESGGGFSFMLGFSAIATVLSCAGIFAAHVSSQKNIVLEKVAL